MLILVPNKTFYYINAKMGEILDQGIKYSREVVHNLLPGICKLVVPIPIMKLNIASILVS